MKNILYITLALLLVPFLVKAQDTNQNYIKSTTYQTETTTGTVADDEKIESVSYFDGLGRGLQTIGIRSGGDRENIVTYMEYDELGMQPKQYLPWASNGQVPVGDALDFITPATLKLDIENFYDTPKYENTDNPYSETRYEKSSLFRPLEQGAPGNSWMIDPAADTDHTIKFEYRLNTGLIYQFSVNFPGGNYSDPQLQYDGNYGSSELYVTQTRDENWQPTDGIYGKTYEYKNKAGQVILKRTTVENPINGPQDPNYHDTYYVYDDYGNLTFVLSPKASDEMVKNGALTSHAQTVLDNLGYQYKYDRRNRLIWKKLPEKGFEVIVYDTQDRPILTQDALMRADNPNKFLFTKYDCLGRVAYTGFHISSYTLRTDVQNDVPSQANCEVMTASSGPIGGTTVYYTNGAYPTTNLDLLTVNYYDDYVDYSPLVRPTNVYGINPTLSETHGLPTVSKIRVLDTTNWITSLSEYDTKGRGIYTASYNSYLNTTDISYSQLDFVGKPNETTTTHTKTGNATITTLDYFTYDQTGRLISHKQKIDNEPLQLIAENYYDELGQLYRKDVGGETIMGGYTAIQNADVTYDGIITRSTPGPPSWDSGVKTKGEILTDGGVHYTYNNSNEDKAIRVGLEKTNSSFLSWENFDYAIYHLTVDSNSDGLKDIKLMINNTLEHTIVAGYQDGDTFSIERQGGYIYFKKNGVQIGSPEPDNSLVGVVGKASFYSGDGSITNFELFGTTIDTKLQVITYDYNIRGWLTDINNIEDQSINPKLFNFRINYDQVEGNNNGTALYNGNIAQTLWKTGNTDAQIRGYNYDYDDLNRITTANGYKGSLLTSMSAANAHDVSGIIYDKNGNIENLTRRGSNELGNASGVWDDLSYDYGSYSNQLLKVTDAATDVNYKDLGFNDGNVGVLDDFEYDVNGNMVKDRNKEIGSISYNHLNLPVSIVFDTLPQQINYVYDATGIKLKKSVTDEGTVTTEYAGNYIYNNAEDGTMKLQFLNHPEGYIVPVANTGGSVKGSFGGTTTYSGYSYVFQYKDHLGNVRLSYSDSDLDGAITQSEIIEESNYYPFGLKQKGYNNTVSSNGNSLAQAWNYLGQERQEEMGLGWDSYKWRNADPALGRFFGVDPIAEDYLYLTPYQFASNNPVWKIELEGLEGVPVSGYDLINEGLNYLEANFSDNDNVQRYVGGMRTGMGMTPQGMVDNYIASTSESINNLESASSVEEVADGTAELVLPLYKDVKNLISTGKAAMNGDTQAQGSIMMGVLTALLVRKTGGGTSRSKSSTGSSSKKATGEVFSVDRNISNNPKTGGPVIDAEAKGRTHTQLGTKTSSNDGVGKYNTRRTIDSDGNVRKQVDYTDHGRPKNHANPHTHVYHKKLGGYKRQKKDYYDF